MSDVVGKDAGWLEGHWGLSDRRKESGFVWEHYRATNGSGTENRAKRVISRVDNPVAFVEASRFSAESETVCAGEGAG
jgi:hypothetical protein